MADVLRPGVRTFKPRRSRISARGARALVEQADLLIPVTDDVVDLAAIWAELPVVLEIGFGTGAATAQLAAAEPGIAIVAVDVHTPGVGDLLHRLAAERLTNVRVIEGDALHVLRHMIGPASLTGVRSFFPDPWPKTRHHKRRLVQPTVLDLVRSRLVPGGYWHLATDQSDYADQAAAVFAADARWFGRRLDRPDQRPVTPYERRAIDAGRPVVDLLYRTTSSEPPTTTMG